MLAPFCASATAKARPMLFRAPVTMATLPARSFAAGVAAPARPASAAAATHAIATLERQLGVALFDRSARRPRLTPAGEAILAEARSVLERTERLQARAQGMARGLEGEVSLAVSVVLPTERLIRALDR